MDDIRKLSQTGYSLGELVCVLSLSLSTVSWALHSVHLARWNRFCLQQESFRLISWLNTLKRYAHRVQRPLTVKYSCCSTSKNEHAWILEAKFEQFQNIGSLSSLDRKTVLYPPCQQGETLRLFGFRNTALATRFTLCRQNECIQVILSSKARIRRCALVGSFKGMESCAQIRTE